MRPGTIHVVTKGSNVWIDETNSEYLRLPRHEGPRERAEWSDERAGALQDAVWHPFTGRWRLGLLPGADAPGLVIEYQEGDDKLLAWFPNAKVVT